MKRPLLALLLLLICCSCSHAPAVPAQEEEAQIGHMDRGEADARMLETQKELDAVTEKLRTAESQLSRYELQAVDNTAKQDAVEGTRSEVSSLQSRRGALLHRQHLLEARLRELGWTK